MQVQLQASARPVSAPATPNRPPTTGRNPMPGRFAPTPSGRMHIGNIYAMLGAWLSARSRGDGMLLRIEDIDEPRVVPGAAEL
ncbi:glutamate--tRNA ligase family protein, partial [Bifidobacterium adolescentis]|uniref:glutamate--tRNA ligase family protein n=1 Tax=Bifidobacterium adolescentis TaxID=1680 RepID=UPI003D794706